MERKVRVRFAPSPTGPLHMGGVRTALYNYLFARQRGGDFILRIEDTDSHRFVPGAEAYIMEALKWCGITIDEGISEGGPHAPYRQSERKEIYLKYALQLVESGNAYYAFDTPEELNAIRAEAEAAGNTFAYNYEVRGKLATSLALPPDEVQRRIERGDQWVIRFRMPENEEVEMHDLIRGDVVVNTSTLDDKVLYKSADSLPTYHLANIVDDHLMEITHVIRGEEWLPSLPLHYLLYRAFGWSETQPDFAHLPLLLKPTGGGKLSKRDGDKMGFPVFPLRWVSPQGEVSHGYREDGYFPEAFINMLALLGWNPGTEQELFTMDELIAAFPLVQCPIPQTEIRRGTGCPVPPGTDRKGYRGFRRESRTGDGPDERTRHVRQRTVGADLIPVRRPGRLRSQGCRQVLERRQPGPHPGAARPARNRYGLRKGKHRKERNGMDRGKRISDRTGDECVPARNHRQKYRTQHVRSV